MRMEVHKKVYLNYFGYKEGDWGPCEKCQKKLGHDVHHITGRGDGKDVIENLMLLCRKCHNLFHDEHFWDVEEMQKTHNNFMKVFNLMRNL